MSENLNGNVGEYSQSIYLSDTFDLINKINKRFKDLHVKFIKKHQITLPQYCVTRNLGEFGNLQIKDLALKCSLSRPTMTGIIDTMEKNGLVERVMNREDRRGIFIKLTEKGEKLYHTLPKQNEIFKECCVALSPKEVQDLNRLLVKLLLSFKEKP